MYPGIVLVDLYITSFNPHDHFIREKLLVLFYICGLERLRYIPHIMEEGLQVLNLGISDNPSPPCPAPPQSSAHSVLCSFPGGNEDIESG